MQKVQLRLTLVGKSNAWERGLSKDTIAQFTNEYRLSVVRDTVIGYFGDRALMIANESRLENNIATYPEFYSAGWFTSQDNEMSELVVVGHGSTMEASTKAMMETVKLVDWEQCSVKIKAI